MDRSDAADGVGRAGSRGETESDLPSGLGKPAQRTLTSAGYARLEQFTAVNEGEVLKLHGMGPKALEKIRRALAVKGRSFAAGSGDT